MRQLFQFIYRLRVFFTFVVLELLAVWLIVQNRNYQGYAILSTSNRVVGNVYTASSNVSGYFGLKAQNDKLLRENARLSKRFYSKDSLQVAPLANDSTKSGLFDFLPAYVVNNTTIYSDNYITIDKGAAHGIQAGMGVMTSEGIVGKVKMTSSQFSTIYSVLHSDLTISAQTRQEKILCSVKWNSGGTENSHRQAELMYVDMQHDIQQGDTVETSGYNSVFPEGILIGVVDTVYKKKSEMFQQVKIDLVTDFSTLKHVYVIENQLKSEKDSIEILSKEQN